MIDINKALLISIDYQEGYRPVLHRWDQTIDRARILLSGMDLLDIPIIYTEQYPKGVGPTCQEIADVLPPASRRFEKQTLSACGAPGLIEYLEDLRRNQVIVAGIETHACINHTVHDLLERNYTVHLPIDTLSSRRTLEHEQGLEKMLRGGALPSSVEQVLLELVQSANHPKFKLVRQLIK